MVVKEALMPGDAGLPLGSYVDMQRGSVYDASLCAAGIYTMIFASVGAC